MFAYSALWFGPLPYAGESDPHLFRMGSISWSAPMVVWVGVRVAATMAAQRGTGGRARTQPARRRRARGRHLGAGAAHAGLNTPLATMAVLLADLRRC
ncbi:MAG: hypothetical protein IPH76_18855 [Xanthomonadales bacterium]|nr:hypothetical protein [Xanthomonadales bacterium]